MPQSNPGQSPLQSHQASSQALLDELRLAADRARDERLKLARLVKHSADLPVSGPTPDPVAQTTDDARFVTLAQQVESLEQAVEDKLASLTKVQGEIEHRAQYLESLRHTITDTTRAFVNQVEEAQHFKAHIDAAKQHVKMSAGKVAEDVRQKLAQTERPIADRLTQLDEMDRQIDQRIARMQQMHKQASEAVDKHLLAALRTAKEQAADLAQPLKEAVDQHLADQSEKIERAIQAKIAALDVDVEEALRPLTERFDAIVDNAQGKADALAESLPKRIEALVSEQTDVIRKHLAEQATQIVGGIDEETLKQAEAVIHEKIAIALDGYLAKADEEAGGYVDGLIAKLDDSREQAIGRFLDSVQKIEVDCSIDREQMLAKLGDEVDRLRTLADERVANAQRVVEEAADGIHARAASAVDAALNSADAKLDAYESAAVEHLRAIDDGIEHGIEQSRKRLADHDKLARKLGTEALETTESAIAAAQQRLAQFEAGITQRIGLATQSVDEAVGSIDGRLERVEQDASARIMQIVDLAENSGKAVADSIASLADSAEQTAERAQADLDEKLEAFENISAEALKRAEQTLRENIGELRDSSRAMIEVVSRQVKAQANDIEPQTREVIQQAEQTMRRRIGELRDSAQSMVELTVSRLEAQLDEVKTKAQHAAFKGVKPNDAA
ncbi:MAG: hypothetical protein ACPGYV_04345 [Phycisphaeraceae bacterium]